MNNITAIYLLDTLVGTLDTDGSNDYDDALHMAIDALQQPERKKGKWDTALRDDPLIKTSDCICSICGGITFGTPDFCSNCGADMRERRTDEVD